MKGAADALRALTTPVGSNGAGLLAADGPVIRGSDVKSRSIRWAWSGRFAVGYMTVQTGEEGLGKSVFDAWVIARATRGELDGCWNAPVSVLVVAGEDAINDTWIPRLDLAGADRNYVAFLDMDALPTDWNIKDGIGQLVDAITGTHAQLVMLDALLDHMPPARGGENINSPTFVRDALYPLKNLVRVLEIVALFSLHPPKSKGTAYRDLVQASQAFSAIPRLGLYFAWHPDDEELPDHERRRVLIRGKGNIGRNPGALEFKVAGRNYLHDDGVEQEREVVEDVFTSEVTLRDLMPGKQLGERQPTKAERAAEIIRAALADGEWHDSQPIRDELYREGLNHNDTVGRAKDKARVESRKEPGVIDGPWQWRLRPGETKSRFGTDSSPPRARRYSDDRLFAPKTPETPVGTGRVEESALSNQNGSGESKSRSAWTHRADAREAVDNYRPGKNQDGEECAF